MSEYMQAFIRIQHNIMQLIYKVLIYALLKTHYKEAIIVVAQLLRMSVISSLYGNLELLTSVHTYECNGI